MPSMPASSTSNLQPELSCLPPPPPAFLPPSLLQDSEVLLLKQAVSHLVMFLELSGGVQLL